MSEAMSEPEILLSPTSSFTLEAREILPVLSRGLLRLEDRTSGEIDYDPLFDGWQRLRSAAAASGADGVSRVCQGCARALYGIKKGQALSVQPLIDELLAACDWLASVAEATEPPVEGRQETDATNLLDRLAAALQQARETAPPEVPHAAPTSSWPPPSRGLPAEAVKSFVAEGTDHLAEAESALLALEGSPEDAEAVNRLFRAVHSIKGAAGFVGLAQLAALGHRLENLLELARAGRLEWNVHVADVIFQGVDELKSMVQALTPDGEGGNDPQQLLAALEAIAKSPLDPNPEAEALPAAGSREEIFRLSAEPMLSRVASCCRAVAMGDSSEAVLTALLEALTTLHNAANYMGRDDLVVPAAELLSGVNALRSSQVALRERIAALFGTETPVETPDLVEVPLPEAVEMPVDEPAESPVLVTPPVPEEPQVTAVAIVPEEPTKEPDPPKPAVAAREKEPAKGAQTAQTMRIDQHKLDEYVNLAGELVIARNALAHVFKQFHPERGNARPLKECVEKVHRIVGDIQNNALSMRMVPVNTLFQRFPRLIRDLSKTLGKQIELRHFGGETELDKQVSEALADPLVHLIRNSADHGIEPPDVRRERGKNEEGLITLRAGREGNTIVIDIVDDGAGINTDRLKAKAVEKGIITEAQADKLTQAEALELIFAPGLSTAKEISDVSGRGVGMDVVRSNVAALGGSVAVSSELGVGSKLRLQLPLTLAVSNVILVGSGNHTYAVPLECVKEMVKILPKDIKQLKGQRAISLRGQVIVLKSLRELLAIRNGDEPHEGQLEVDANGRVVVIVVVVGEATYGITVDDLRGQQEMVIKPLPDSLGSLPGLGGATITGDGSVVLILDPAALYQMAIDSRITSPTAA